VTPSRHCARPLESLPHERRATVWSRLKGIAVQEVVSLADPEGRFGKICGEEIFCYSTRLFAALAIHP
jgi:hypothetical protein